MIQPAARSAGVDIDGPEVRERRKLRGANIRAFARRCGISESYLCAIERERRKTVSPEVFAKICDELGIAPKRRGELVRKPAVKA